MTQKFTTNFLNFYLSIADFEVFPKKKCILSYLSIGLSVFMLGPFRSTWVGRMDFFFVCVTGTYNCLLRWTN